MTDDEKAKMAEQEAEIARLKDRLAGKGEDGGGGDVRANAVAAMEEVESTEPTPSQAELDRMKTGSAHIEAGKAGGYRTRQSKPA